MKPKTREEEMKQHITTKQLNELSKKGKKRLREWWKPRLGDCLIGHYDGDIHAIGSGCWSGECECPTEEYFDKEANKSLPFLSIGQMIEFLDDNKIHNFHPLDRCVETKGAKGWHVVMGEEYGGHTYDYEELCDALWEAVKEFLEK